MNKCARIHTSPVKYADDLVLLAKEETMLQGEKKNPKLMRQPSIIELIIDQKQLENVEYFNFWGSVINYAKHTHETKSRMTMAKAAFNRKALPTSKLSLNLRKV